MSDAPAEHESGPAPESDPLSSRDLQEQADETPLETPPGSDADHAAEVPHVG